MKDTPHSVISMRMADGNVIKFEHYDTIPSTATLAREYAKANYPDRYVIFSERQTDTSLTKTVLKDGQTDHGIFMSVILRPSFFPAQAMLLGAMSAVALYQGLSASTDEKLGIGWVSDIYCGGKMIGSASREGKLDSFGSYEYLILNFGIRLNDKDFPPRLSDIMKQVFTKDSDTVEMIMAKAILNAFFPMYSSIKETDMKFMDVYRKNFLLRSKKVLYFEGEKKLWGKVIGIDNNDGRLLLENKKGEILRIGSQSAVILPTVIK